MGNNGRQHSSSSSDPQESYQCLDPFGDSEEKSFLLDLEQSKDFHIEGIDFVTPHCNEHGTIYAISSDFSDRMTTQSMGLMVLLSEHF